MAKHDIKLSQNAYDELSTALQAQQIVLNKDDTILITKDIALIAPVNYKQTQIRRDVLEEVVKVYKSPVDEREMELTDSKHFIDFLDAVYKYVLSGDKPTETQIITVEPKPKKPTPVIKPTAWK